MGPAPFNMGEDDDQGWKMVRGRNNKRNDSTQHNMDIATTRDFNKENINTLTTFFLTNFPDSFGARAMFNAFHHYGEVKDVVIPAKRDKGGKRFGFARFDRVVDSREFEHTLDQIIIGRDKISAKIAGENSYAQAVRTGEATIKGAGQKRCVVTYEAEQDDLLRWKKAYVGVVVNPGMTYNIQNAFHSQGYFGVKVTPLGSNLALLEGQEEGEVQALIDDVKDWMDQWFREIRPWSPKDVDVDRVAWLRIYGIP
ncbi:hypothetical protein TSUD_289300 [Trifolium subterraneum]|uniref:RRM domain-containing protein n=1 Tax=Trifolium subterraneum TaxID=3900 RepID=A0A2Z6MT39_TRISU|nr:hypothetical protein TSUD_289300 [Trifolium subterraneum]